MLILYENIKDNEWTKVGQTEQILYDRDPDFVTSFILEFIFETK